MSSAICPHCGHKHKLPGGDVEQFRGRKARCNGCSETFALDGSSLMPKSEATESHPRPKATQPAAAGVAPSTRPAAAKQTASAASKPPAPPSPPSETPSLPKPSTAQYFSDKEWHYVIRGQQIGPVGIDDLKRLYAKGVIVPQTLVWKEGMEQWQHAEETPLMDTFSQMKSGRRAPEVPKGYEPTPHFGGTADWEDEEKLEPPPRPVRYYIGLGNFLLISMLALPALLVLLGSLGAMDLGIYPEDAAVIIVPLALVAMLTATAAQFILIYRSWELIQDGNVRTSPGVAIGFLFVPLVNLFWMFQAIHGLAQDMNLYSPARNVQRSKVNEKLSLSCCVGVLFVVAASIINKFLPFDWGVIGGAVATLALMLIVSFQFSRAAADIAAFKEGLAES